MVCRFRVSSLSRSTLCVPRYPVRTLTPCAHLGTPYVPLHLHVPWYPIHTLVPCVYLGTLYVCTSTLVRILTPVCTSLPYTYLCTCVYFCTYTDLDTLCVPWYLFVPRYSVRTSTPSVYHGTVYVPRYSVCTYLGTVCARRYPP